MNVSTILSCLMVLLSLSSLSLCMEPPSLLERCKQYLVTNVIAQSKDLDKAQALIDKLPDERCRERARNLIRALYGWNTLGFLIKPEEQDTPYPRPYAHITQQAAGLDITDAAGVTRSFTYAALGIMAGAPTALTPDASRLVTIAGKSIQVHDCTTGTCINTINTLSSVINAAGISPNGTYIVIGSNTDKMLRLYNATTGKELNTKTIFTPFATRIGHITPDNSGRFVCFSRDNQRWTTGHPYVWDSKDNRVRALSNPVLKGSGLSGFVHLPQQALAVCLSETGWANIQDMKTGKRMRSLTRIASGQADEVPYAGLANEGTTLNVCLDSGKTIEWKVDTANKILFAMILRNLTDQDDQERINLFVNSTFTTFTPAQQKVLRAASIPALYDQARSYGAPWDNSKDLFCKAKQWLETKIANAQKSGDTERLIYLANHPALGIFEDEEWYALKQKTTITAKPSRVFLKDATKLASEKHTSKTHVITRF